MQYCHQFTSLRAVTADVERSRQNKLSNRFSRLSIYLCVKCCIDKGHTVSVVKITMLPIVIVKIVFRHSHIWATDGSFMSFQIEVLYVDPFPQLWIKLCRPLSSSFRVEAIHTERGYGLAPTLVSRSIFVLDA